MIMRVLDTASLTVQHPKLFQKQGSGVENYQGIASGSFTIILEVLKRASASIHTLQNSLCEGQERAKKLFQALRNSLNTAEPFSEGFHGSSGAPFGTLRKYL